MQSEFGTFKHHMVGFFFCFIYLMKTTEHTHTDSPVEQREGENKQKEMQKENERSILTESLGPQPLGRWPHLLLLALRHKGLQHLNDAEDRSALLRFIRWQRNKPLQSELQHASCWMTNEVCELQPLLQGWKGARKMHQTFRLHATPGSLLCGGIRQRHWCSLYSPSRWSAQWQICSICASAGSDHH